MRKHRVHGIALAVIVAGGLAFSRTSSTGVGAVTYALIGGHVGSHQATARMIANVEPRATPARSGGWRDIAQTVTFNARGGITTEPDSAARAGGPAHTTERSTTLIIDSTAVSEQAHLQEVAVFLNAVQTQELQQYLEVLYYREVLYDLQQLATAVAAQRAAAARAAAAPPAAPPAPAPQTVGGAGGVWAALRNCESGGNYAENTGNGFYGAYQFSLATWHGLGYSGYPNEAAAAVQDAAAAQLQARSGWGQWPVCSRRLGL